MTENRQKIQNALFRTIKSYKLLIAHPILARENWGEYGDYHACTLCRAVGVNSKRSAQNCFKCPLARGNEKTPCMNDSLQLLRDSINYDVGNICLIRNAKRRLNYILRTAKKNGWMVTND
jgi:hypothetical protein